MYRLFTAVYNQNKIICGSDDMNCVRVKWVTDRGPIISVTINLDKVAAKTIKLHKRYRYMYILHL